MMKPPCCTVDDCSRPQKARGLCGVHYGRWYRHGDPAKHRRTLEQGFHARVARRGADECWKWTGSRNPEGYGLAAHRFGSKTLMTKAHRVAFFLEYGYFPALVRHTCDNPPCVNPAHLLPGTLLDNVRDRDRRGRTAKGTQRPQAKLTDEDVVAIRVRRAAGERTTALAREFGIAPCNVSNITAGRSWRHIPIPKGCG